MSEETKPASSGDEVVAAEAVVVDSSGNVQAAGIVAADTDHALLVAEFADPNAALETYQALIEAETAGQITVDGVVVGTVVSVLGPVMTLTGVGFPVSEKVATVAVFDPTIEQVGVGGNSIVVTGGAGPGPVGTSIPTKSTNAMIRKFTSSVRKLP